MDNPIQLLRDGKADEFKVYLKEQLNQRRDDILQNIKTKMVQSLGKKKQ